MEWNREAVIETIENLAMSQGSYGRLLKALEECQQYDPDRYEEIMDSLVEAGSALDMILMIEG